MNKVLIVSDSHGLIEELQMIKERHDISHMIHCGDSELSMDEPVMEDFITVAGNCDYDSRYPNEKMLHIGDETLFITHGHFYRVKSGLLSLSYRAAEVGARIVCFGHSHIAGAEKIDGRIYINPGSIRMPRGRGEKTYALLTWDNDQHIDAQFYDVQGKVITELSTTFSLT
ncbi:MAG TPA: metallophosphoesterase [Virgibacillus sp.]|nr:metallophosphoesterase [Virgibacillus sp.]